ncbi:MAG: fucose isomerase [Spirochaeta sp.]|jgi:L-fucose mutarotase|nr:fucose isomerase [Spirochaeta sp.]
MLKNIDPILNAELLYVLRAMGHGDELVIVDSNFPSTSVASTTVMEEPIELEGVDIPMAARAILSLLPLDSFVEEPVIRMEVVGAPEEIVECHRDMQTAMDADGRTWKMGHMERHAFYERASNAFAVVTAMNERRPYGCFVLTKGVIGPDGNVV